MLAYEGQKQRNPLQTLPLLIVVVMLEDNKTALTELRNTGAEEISAFHEDTMIDMIVRAFQKHIAHDFIG